MHRVADLACMDRCKNRLFNWAQQEQGFPLNRNVYAPFSNFRVSEAEAEELGLQLDYHLIATQAHLRQYGKGAIMVREQFLWAGIMEGATHAFV
jgi:hypothetical protein